MNPYLTSPEREMMELLAQGLTLSAIAQRMQISDYALDLHREAVLRKLGLATTAEMRVLAVRAFASKSSGRSVAPSLEYEISRLPNIVINPRSAFGTACRALVRGDTLRDAAEYVLDLDTAPGATPDDFKSIVKGGTGTIGAKQAFLAAIALDSGRKDLPLLVACCELPLPRLTVRLPASETDGPQTLPLAVCMLKFKRRRIQIARRCEQSAYSVAPITESTVLPDRLATERVRLYRGFAADWCRALDRDPRVFARLRARYLSAAVPGSAFEDLMGHRLAKNYTPTV